MARRVEEGQLLWLFGLAPGSLKGPARGGAVAGLTLQRRPSRRGAGPRRTLKSRAGHSHCVLESDGPQKFGYAPDVARSVTPVGHPRRQGCGPHNGTALASGTAKLPRE